MCLWGEVFERLCVCGGRCLSECLWGEVFERVCVCGGRCLSVCGGRCLSVCLGGVFEFVGGEGV